MLNNQSILVTGGTGSFGNEFIKIVTRRFKKIKRLVIFSRDEFKQFEMSKIYTKKKYPFLRYFIGDIRDKDRLLRAFQNIDIVIHAAALKQVPTAEYNPFEYVKTNILGAENIIDASLDSEVKNVVALSTDKATAPINLYGATKLCSDKLFVSANNIRGLKRIKFNVVRYGNVMGSRGSVAPFFLKTKNRGFFPITDTRMTRFNISLEDAVEAVLKCIKYSIGGEIMVPKIPSYKIVDLAKAINPRNKFKIIGIRPGEKIHEEMITINDGLNTLDIGDYYVILPPHHEFRGKDLNLKNIYLKKRKAKKVENNFSYNSGDNKVFLTIEQLRKIISKSYFNRTSN